MTLLAAGCSTATAPPTTPPRTTPVPMTLSRAEAITWARGIDPCALIAPDQLAALGTVNAVGTSSNSTSCAAHVDDGTDRGVDVNWAIAFVPNDFQTAPVGSLEQIDGRQVRRTDVASAFEPSVRDQLVESACTFDVAFENEIAVRMRVSTARDRDACAAGDPLARAVISAWPGQPRQGSSPDTTVTVVTDAAPCAVVPELQKSRQVTFDWKDQSLTSCFFTVDGTEILLTFDHQRPELVAGGADRTKFGQHSGYRKVHDETTFAGAIVGDEFDGVVSGRVTRVVPAVDVNGDDSAVVSDVMTAVLNQLPI
ncbi:DUF3558 family protein [Mycolicibacterium sp. HK-90]|uniref:DUF3558 family protein n=1 Tax=Mycolicibacterium sp. HK-90 TaxID=3056937 RepID=UPI0026596526|nr:DUF3558 family protein [Mycolicibacterium sp. HK-90]WKG05843.1 DUF3558 family protein [Mycolicibacterium sp. HK-90]